MKCLCCGQEMSRPGNPVTPERAARAYGFLIGLGWTRAALLARKENLEYQTPGLYAYIAGRDAEAGDPP